MGYTRHAIKGVSWMTGVRGAVRLFSFIRTLIIARILTPSQVGVFGIATLLLALIEILTETGINIFLVQQKEAIDKFIDTAWLVSIIRGILIGVIIFLSVPFVSTFFHAPQAVFLLQLTSTVPLIRGFINPSVITFQKELQFHKQFFYQVSLSFVEITSSIILLFLTHSVSSLIWGMVISASYEVAFSFVTISLRPKLVFEPALFKQVMHVGKWITLAGIADYFYQQGDDMVVGRMLGTGALGLYDMAYRLTLAPMNDVSDILSKVAFPVYVKISDDKERLQRAYLRSLIIIAAFVVPVSLILELFPRPIISLVLGSQWLAAAPVLQVLAVAGALRAVSTYTSSLFLSLKKQHIVTLTYFVGLLGLGITIIPFVMWWGIVGASLSAFVGTAMTFVVIIYYLHKIFNR